MPRRGTGNSEKAAQGPGGNLCALKQSEFSPDTAIGAGESSHAPYVRSIQAVSSIPRYRLRVRSGFSVSAPATRGVILNPSVSSVAQAGTALGTATSQNLAAIGSGHTLAEAMLLGALTLLRLIGTNHVGTPPHQNSSRLSRPNNSPEGCGLCFRGQARNRSVSLQTGAVTHKQRKAILIIDEVPRFCQHNFSFWLFFITLFHRITISCVSFSARHKAGALFVDSSVENSIPLYKNIPQNLAGLSAVWYNVRCGIFVFFPLPTPSPPSGEGALSGSAPAKRGIDT